MDDSTSQIVLFADFDSANMAKYEKVAKTPASLLNTILAAQYTAQTTSSPKLVSSTSSTTTTGKIFFNILPQKSKKLF